MEQKTGVLTQRMLDRLAEVHEFEAQTAAILTAGKAALDRLLAVAHGHSGQCRTVAAFLLGLYNGPEYRFDLTSLRGLDLELQRDCMAVLAMDYTAKVEVHELIEGGSQVFLALASRWGLPD